MAKKKKAPVKKKTFPILPAVLGSIALVLVLTIGGFSFAATQESRDAFCASCHTQPESTFYQNSQGSQAVDMASAHTPKNVRCIDCHSGVGVTGRVQAELLGARNAVLWYSGTAKQPAPLTNPIPDANCLKCHQQVTTQSEGRQNHFHYFLSRWQAQDPNAAGCVSCHSGHSTDTSAVYNQEQAANRQVCDACHQVLGRD